jgi:decaprenylphospho-beta-D-erythro-pentofuranosid-2-ulose 2-reductase
VPTAVLIGASSGVGRALGRRLASAGYSLVIVSRDARDIEASAADLRLRFGVECWPVAQDIADPSWDVDTFAAECHERLGTLDALLVPAGGGLPGDAGPNSKAVNEALGANYAGPARAAAAFGCLMSARGHGTIVLFSSIAAAAPRTKNTAYSAAKAALEAYAAGLRHALSQRGVSVIVIALGYVDSAQTFGLRLPFPVARAERVADYVLSRLNQRSPAGGKYYFPWFWWLVTTGLRCLPWFVYRRLRF